MAKPKMPPPPAAKPKLAIAIDVGPKGAPSADMPPQGGNASGNAGGKMSTDQALVVRADFHCRDCKQYDPTDGSCAKVDGNFDPEDACLRWFTPISGGEDYEPDEDDNGGAPDADQDDSMGAPQAQ